MSMKAQELRVSIRQLVKNRDYTENPSLEAIPSHQIQKRRKERPIPCGDSTGEIVVALPRKIESMPHMTEIANFKQPDVSPMYFIDFLEFLDNDDDIKRVRAEFNKRMNLAPGN